MTERSVETRLETLERAVKALQDEMERVTDAIKTLRSNSEDKEAA